MEPALKRTKTAGAHAASLCRSQKQLDDEDAGTVMHEHRALYEEGDFVQCSSSNDYCFLCENVDPEGSDGNAAAIRSFVRELVAQKKEMPFVVNSVHTIYTSEMNEQTPWSKQSIKRHLLFSSEFDGLFACVVDQLFISIIMRTQSRMIDETGGIDEVNRKALLETVAAFGKWKKDRK